MENLKRKEKKFSARHNFYFDYYMICYLSDVLFSVLIWSVRESLSLPVSFPERKQTPENTAFGIAAFFFTATASKTRCQVKEKQPNPAARFKLTTQA